MADQPKILIADDDPTIVRLLSALLKPLDVEIFTASDGAEALEQAREVLPDVAIIDVVMPEKSGWEVCQTLKNVERTNPIKIVLMTGKGEVKDRLTGLQLGADDYIVKPFDGNDVTWRISRLLDIRRRQHTRSAEDDRIRSLVHDAATDLPTISACVPKMKEMLIEHGLLGIVYVDIEQMEQVEVEYGWAFFDELLRGASSLVEKEAEANGGMACVSRVGSSGFYVCKTGSRAALGAEVTALARNIHERLSDALLDRYPQFSSGELVFFTGTAVVAYSPQIRLERQIYKGLQQAFDTVRDAEAQTRRGLVEEMEAIINEKKVRVLFQPIVEASDLSIFGYELLTRGPASSSFRNSDILFEFARRNGLAWALEQVAIECMVKKLRREKLQDRALLINLEAETVDAFTRQFNEMMSEVRDNPERLVFELTERAAIEDFSAFRETLSRLKAHGVSIAIDDAGSGYASLEAIASLAPNYLKIAKGLVSALATEPIKQDLMKLLVDLAKRIGARTIAEGIETEEEYEWCRTLGIDLLQGFYFAMPSEELVTAVEPRTRRKRAAG